ncbi:hemagglutinin repeat-containing protein, partial [Achromobacter xylosoxidans]
AGALGVNAQRDINVLAGDSAGYTYNETYFKEKGFLSSRKTHRKSEAEWTQGVSSTFGGDTAAMLAGRDMTVLGSNVLGDRDVGIAVGGDLQVLAKAETYKDYQYEKVKKSGLGGGGGFSIGYSTQQRTDWMRGASGGYSASTVGSAGGNLGIDAGRNVNVMASNLLAQDGNISVAGSNVAILAGVGYARQHEYHELKQSGLTIGVAGGMLGAAQQIQGTLQQAGEAKDGRLAAVKVGQAAYQAVQANRMMDAAKADNASAAQKEAASAQIQISLGVSKSVSETRRTQDTAFASSVMAGGDLSLMAAGERDAAGTGNVSIISSDLVGRNMLLAATNDLMLQSQAETSTEVSTSKNSGWKVGVGIGVSDSGSGGGINVFASGHAGGGKAHGNGTTHRETQVIARDNLALLSGQDTLLEGAQARADRIRADIGRNLTLASQQDSDRYDARQKQVNAGGSFSFGSMTGNAYLGASVGKTKSNYDSVVEQTGLYAGAGGYDIHVGKHTQLDGAVIASDANATTNRLSTETLGFSDLHNKAQYKSTTVGINLGMSGAFDKPNKGAALGAGPSGLSFASTSGSETGTTRAAVSVGTLAVRSDKETGRDSTAGLSRDTAGANGSIGKIFDKDKVREQLEFQQAFGQLGMLIAGDVTKKLAKNDPEIWGEGRIGKVAVHSIVAAAGAALGGGNVAGAISGTVAGDLASAAFKDAIDEVMSGLPPAIQREVANIALNALAGAAGGLAGGVSGAGAALSADMFNRQLHPDEKELTKKLALEAKNIGYDVTVEQIETQLRRMDVTLLDGETHAGTAAVVIGDDGIFDKATNFVLVGRADDDRNIWMEVPSPADRQLQEFIVANANARDIPTGLNYRLEPDRSNYWDNFASPGSTVKFTSAFSRYCVTAECAAGLARLMSPADYNDRGNQNADVIAYLAKANGRFSAIAGTLGRVPSPYAPIFQEAAKGADIGGLLLGGLEQMIRPNPIAYAIGGGVDLAVKGAGAVVPDGGILFNELGEYLKARYAD